MNWEKANKDSLTKRRAREDRPATPAQMSLIKALSEETGRTYPQGLTISEASDWITSLKQTKRRSKRRGTFEANQ